MPGVAGVVLFALPAAGESAAGMLDDHADIQRHQAQTLDAQRDRAGQRPDVLSADWASSETAAQALRFPVETPCFDLRSIIWQGERPTIALRHQAETALGACVGGKGLKALQTQLTAGLIERGRVTASVLVPRQSLRHGQLTLRYLPGRIAAVKGDSKTGWWRTVVPTGPGGDLNQRDLDQTLENMRRLASQTDARINITPGETLGESDIIIQPGTGKRWHGYIGGDNSGLRSIESYQTYAGLSLDSPLFLYDLLSVSWGSNAGWRDHDSNTRAGSVSYSLPFGYWTFFASAGKSTYHQALAGGSAPVIYGGVTKQLQAGLSVVPYRGSSYKGSASLTLLRKRASSSLNDVPIDVQRRDVTGYELAYEHRHYVGRTVLDIGAGIRGTLRRFSDQPGVAHDEPGWNGRTTILTANAGVYIPFHALGQTFSYQTSWQIQHARTPIVPVDYFTIGGRYTVRGFDGQMMLAAEDGWSIRNDFSLNLDPLIHAPGHQAYTGLDAGRTGGPLVKYLSGRTLVGAVVGVRGRFDVPYGKVGYDISAGRPLSKPGTLKTASTVYSLALMLEI